MLAGDFPLSRSIQDIELAKARNRTSMAYGIGLARLAFSIIGCAVQFVGAFAADAVTGIPEISRARLISDIAQHVTDFSFFDLPKSLPPELKVITLLIDRPTAVAIDQDAIVHA